MEYSPILAPVVALVAWTLIIMLWMAIARRSAFAKMGITWGTIPRGSRGVNLDGRAPDEAQWPSHNYNHLMEQPTIFYAIAITLEPAARIWLAEKGYDPVYGARPLARVIQTDVRDPLTDEILFGRLEHGGTVTIDLVDGHLAFAFAETGKTD